MVNRQYIFLCVTRNIDKCDNCDKNIGVFRKSSDINAKRARTENTPGTSGIKNLRNSCYVNSVLQCLANTPELVKLFAQLPADIKSFSALSSDSRDQSFMPKFSEND